MLKKGYRIGYGQDILKSLKLGYYILKKSRSKKGLEISFLPIFGYRIGYTYPFLYILPVSENSVARPPRPIYYDFFSSSLENRAPKMA
jgi:hypothetical protein